MPAALPPDLRKRIIVAIKAGTSCRQAAARFGIGEAQVMKRTSGAQHGRCTQEKAVQ